MNLYLMYLLIFLLTTFFFLLIKDKIKALKLTGIITISSSLLLIVISFIIKYLANTNITMINISTITGYIFTKFIDTSIILLILGIIEIIIGKYFRQKEATK